jgi:hypothetical protein
MKEYLNMPGGDTEKGGKCLPLIYTDNTDQERIGNWKDREFSP